MHPFLLFIVLAFDFVGSTWSFVISSPPQRSMTSDFEGFYTRFYPSHVCPILSLQKEPVFPFVMLNAKQGNY